MVDVQYMHYAELKPFPFPMSHLPTFHCRRQLKKRREREHAEAVAAVRNAAAAVLQKLLRGNHSWVGTMRLIAMEREALRRLR